MKINKKSSIYTGVSWCEKDQRWRAYVYFNKKQHNLGNFITEEEAYIWYVRVTEIINPQHKIKNLKGEIWIDIVLGGNPYAISNKGRMKSYKYRGSDKERLLKPQRNRSGYWRIRIYGKMYFIHVLVANAFLGYKNMMVNHIDGNKDNNCIENLEYVTNRGNVCHGLLRSGKVDLIGAYYRDGGYNAELKFGDKRIFLGKFNTPQEAHGKYMEALRENGFIEDYNYIKGLLGKNN